MIKLFTITNWLIKNQDKSLSRLLIGKRHCTCDHPQLTMFAALHSTWMTHQKSSGVFINDTIFPSDACLTWDSILQSPNAIHPSYPLAALQPIDSCWLIVSNWSLTLSQLEFFSTWTPILAFLSLAFPSWFVKWTIQLTIAVAVLWIPHFLDMTTFYTFCVPVPFTLQLSGI